MFFEDVSHTTNLDSCLLLVEFVSFKMVSIIFFCAIS
jgi:hypothetical protein